MPNSWHSSGTPVQGVALGPLVMIAESDRSTSWLLDSGSSASWVDTWTRAAVAPYVPVGVRALLTMAIIRLNGDGSLDAASYQLRKNGSSSDDGVQTLAGGIYREDMTNAITIGRDAFNITECDSDGIIEYKVSTTSADLWINIHGYYM